MLRVYYLDFGSEEHDKALVAEVDGKVVGAVWVRIMKDYGHVDDETPSFSISLYEEYRGYGIGTEMMKRMLGILKACGYKKASLSSQKANDAVMTTICFRKWSGICIYVKTTGSILVKLSL